MADPSPASLFDREVLAAQALLREKGLSTGDFLRQPVAEVRALNSQYQAFLNEGGPAMAEITELMLEGDHPPVRVRLYRPDRPGPLPTYLHLHGGGFAIGSIDSLDRFKREVAVRSGAMVVGIDYALAPEHAFPTALKQVMTVLRWLPRGGGVGIGGDSAGGNLALSALQRLRDAGEPMPRFAAIIYGMLTGDLTTPSHAAFGGGAFGMSTARLEWFWQRYLGDAPLAGSGAMPLEASLAGLPPMLLVAAALDALLDDTHALDRLLTEAGVPHRLKLFPGMPHGFIAQTALLSQGQAVAEDIADLIRLHLAAPS